MKLQTIIIRADAGPTTGTGHVMRMLALAQAWVRRGGRAVFAAIDLPGPIARRLDGFEIFEVSAVVPGSNADADWTAGLVREIGADWVVIDGYSFDCGFQKTLAKAGARLAVVCDYPIADEFCCDCLINQNLGSRVTDYPGLIAGTQGLFGPDYALLREEFATSPRKSRKTRKEIGRRLLITLGGSDPANLGARLLHWLGPLAEREDWELKLLVGPANAHRTELLRIADRFSKVECLEAVADMRPVLDDADAVLSAGGSTCWELCFQGIPMLVVSIAENQNGIVGALGEREAALNLGWHEDLDEKTLVSAVYDVLRDARLREVLSANALRLVDGRGADRVAAALAGNLRIVLATAAEGWVRGSLNNFVAELEDGGHQVKVVTNAENIPEADIVFYLSFWSLARSEVLERTTHSLVVHASDLPRGKGWSPLTWQILDGINEIPVRLFEAEVAVDSGDIHGETIIRFEGHELLPELRERLLRATYSLCREFVSGYPGNVSRKRRQEGEATFYPRRSPESSRLDPELPLADQFELLRTVDNESYPAFFEYRGHQYEIEIRKRKVT